LRLLQMARIPLSIDTPYAAVSPPQLPQRPLQIGEVFLPHPYYEDHKRSMELLVL
jgi:hypothetical protein